MNLHNYIETLMNNMMDHYPYHPNFGMLRSSTTLTTFLPLSVDLCSEMNQYLHDNDNNQLIHTILLNNNHKSIYYKQVLHILRHSLRLYAVLMKLIKYVSCVNPPSDQKVIISKQECLDFMNQKLEALHCNDLIYTTYIFNVQVKFKMDITFIYDVCSDFFQDIYMLEYLVHHPDNQSKDWTSMTILEHVYYQKYKEIMDPSEWIILIYDFKNNPYLLSHPLLPHPEDFRIYDLPYFTNRLKSPLHRNEYHPIFYKKPLRQISSLL